MIIYPAIDVRGGKVVRLREGDPDLQTVFSDDPVSMAKQWIDEGAEWIHMVNLDGAFDTSNDNFKILEAVAKLNVNVQFGGGLRDAETLQNAYDAGANRLVIGTLAVRNPDAVADAVQAFGAESVCVALDAKDGKVTTHGWTELSVHTPIEFGRLIASKGVRHALYTDVHRDGSMTGVNVQDTITLGQETGLNVIASGGVSSISEIEQLAASDFVSGAIIGMALYLKKLTLGDALLAAKGRD
jgi:phosphoribosylformimino-5-aminoimidazole carboxamide ribotide isomerase